MTTMSKLSIEKKIQNKKMASNLINNWKSWSTMLLISMKKTKTLPSESTCKMLRKKTGNSFNEFYVAILEGTIKICPNFNKCKRMKKIGMRECKKWWNGWGVDRMTKRNSMRMTLRMKMIKRTFITITMGIERESIISRKLLPNRMRSNHNRRISNKFSRNLDTSLWIQSRQQRITLSNPSLLNYWLNCLKCSKKQTSLLINLLPSLIWIWTKKTILKKIMKINKKKRTKTLQAIFSVLGLIKVKVMD